MKSILMATDLSARSDRALERAVVLARELDAKLTVVHVIDDGLPASLARVQETEAKQTIHEHIGLLAAGDAPRISVEVVYGRVYVSILEISEKIKSEIVVLGVHREDAFKDMFRGTTAERVIRAGNIPVLLVKDRVKGPYRKIIVGVDFSIYSRRAVEFAVKFVPGGEFYLLHAYDVPFGGFLYGRDTRNEVCKQHQEQFHKMIDEEMSLFLSSLEPNASKFERIMQEGGVREVISRQLGLLEPDLLVIGTHGRTGVAHAFLGSVAEDLLKAPPCDVLAVKAW